MRILVKIVLFIVVLAAALAVIGMFLPRQVRVERTAVIDAPPATVFALVNSFRQFNKWSPWFDRDPQARYTWEGPGIGVGAKLSWVSDRKEVGSGSQEIVESRPDTLARWKLDFGAQGTAFIQFTLAPEGAGTKVAWALDADMGAGPVGRWFGLAMDRMAGPDFEKGLAGLAKFAAGLPKTDVAGLIVELIDVRPIAVAFVQATSTGDERAIATAIGAAYGQVGQFMKRNGLRQAGAPITINHEWGGAGYRFDAAIPVDRAPDRAVPADSPVQVKNTFGGRALKVVHKGAYRGMEATYDRLAAWMAAYGYEAGGPPWDEYVTDPGSTAEADLVTNVFMPLK